MPRKRTSGLTDAELRLMDVLWEIGSGTVTDVSAALPKDVRLAYSSVLTTLRILEIKGYLRHRKEGRAYHGALSRVQVYRLFRHYVEAAGLSDSKRGGHALKHSLGQHMVDAKQDITRVQAALGHASVSSTARYFQVSDQQADEARQATLMARM